MKTVTFTRLCFLFSLLLTSVNFLSAQNLVENPSFEITSACPQGISGFSLATNWQQGNSGADSCTTADLYAGCSSQIGGANSPDGLLGYQASRTGTHHAGIILTEGFVGCVSLNDNYREYIEGHLSQPLTAGQKYVVKFYVSLAENVMWGTSSIGVYFSNTAYSHNACPNSQLMPVTPQLNYCGDPIMDTINWVEVKWIYTATGGEQYFTIGNFKSDANTVTATHNCQSFNPYAYYYIDDVEVSAAQPNDCNFAIQTSSTNTGCTSNSGTAIATVSGCSSPFNYTWNTGAHTASAFNLAAGTYTVTVSDATSCSSTASVSVGSYQAPTVQVSTINASCGGNNGTAIAGASGGTPPYTYLWNNSTTSQSASNLAVGTYSVTVTSTGSCTASATANITSGSGGFTLTPSFTNAGCGGNTGTATATPSGGTPPYTYAWSNSGTTQTITGLAPGTYTVTVTSSGSSTATPFYTEDFTSGTGWTLNVNGTGTNSTTANQWIINNDGDCTCGTGKYLHITCGGSLFNGCPVAGACTYSLGLPPPFPNGDVTTDKYAVSPVISTVGKTGMTLAFSYMCDGDPGNDYGLVSFSSDGGTTWTDMPTQYSGVATCSQATVNIPSNFENISTFKFAFRWINNSDQNGNDPGFVIDDIQISSGGGGSCPATASVTVGTTSSLTLTASATNATCGNNNGTATTTVTAGTGPYTYAWSNSGNTQSISNLGAGTYTVTVTGQGGCSATASATVAATNGLQLTANATNTACTGAGSATVNVASGNGPYTYLWSNSATTQSISNLSSGTYNVTVTGQGGCSATASVNVVVSNGLSSTFTVNQPSCGNNNGTLSCNGITNGASPITVSWVIAGNVVSNTYQVSNAGSGVYEFHATDANGCTLDTSFTLTAGGLSVAITSDKSVICQGDSAHICAPAGYTAYQWNTGATTQCIYARLQSNYYVTVTDAGNCTVTSNHIALSAYPLTSISITVNGDTMTSYSGVTYQWYYEGTLIPNANSTTYIAPQGGYYNLAITDTNGCTVVSNRITIVKTGLEEIAGENVMIYPNPTMLKGWTIEVGEDMVGSKVEVYNDRGQLVFENTIKNTKSEINFNAAQGVYMLQLRTDKKTITHKLIKL